MTTTTQTAADAVADASETSPATDASQAAAGALASSTPAVLVDAVGLPVRPRRYVSTSIVDGVALAVTIAVRTGGCSLVDGPVGVGKTTAVVEAARALDCEAVYVNMFGTNGVLDQMNAIWTAMTGTPGVGSSSEIRDDILKVLRRKQMVLIIDDVHRVGVTGLAPILAIWNRIHTARGTGTPIILCGNSLENHLKQTLPELLSRSSARYLAKPLTGTQLVDAVLAMEPSIAGTPPATIRSIDTYNFRGEIRRWNQFLDNIALFRGDDPTPRPLTDDEVRQTLSIMPSGNL